MSSTFVADTSDDHKTDNTLIIIVNSDGTISVDQETLQNLLTNQQNTAVSVVRVGGPSQDESSQDSNGTCDSQSDGNPHVNLTVEGFYPPPVASETRATSSTTNASETPASSVPSAPSSVSNSGTTTATHPPEGESLDPFLEMDPEQLERLETALQSEQAKQILGENVTAMLDMLSVEEEATQLKDTILMDHCYTNLSPSSAPPTSSVSSSTNQYNSMSNGRDSDNTVLMEQSDHIQQITTGMGPPVSQTIRGRGRGRPGRPRRDISSTRGAIGSSRGLVRGNISRGGMKLQRGGVVSSTTAGNMIMVQQIKHISPPLAPPPNSPASATLVPVVRPLVIPTSVSGGQISGTSLVRTSTSGQVPKQIIAVPQGARLVAVSGKPTHIDASGQQTVLLTSSTGQVVQAQQISGNPALASSVQSMGNAKVVVAKMPVLPPQLLGAQPSTLPLGEQTPQQLQKEDESDFTDFPQEVSEDSVSEESDIGSDEEYRDPSIGRRGSRGGKGRGRLNRGRARGGHRVYESGRGSRGGRRGGRGRGNLRPEDADRAKKLEAEMAAVVAAMEKSPERLVNIEKISPQENKERSIPKKEENIDPLSIAPTVETSKKKLIKVYGKSVKKNLESVIEDTSIKVESNVKEKNDKLPLIQTSPEKKNAVVKSPVKKHLPENALISSVVTTVESRKNYPKRENRKPPAHLAETLGPALFSTPDIIRRVNTGSDHKTSDALGEEKKDNIKIVPAPLGAGSEKAPEIIRESTEKATQENNLENVEVQNTHSEITPEISDPVTPHILPTEIKEEPIPNEDIIPLKSTEEKPSFDNDKQPVNVVEPNSLECINETELEIEPPVPSQDTNTFQSLTSHTVRTAQGIIKLPSVTTIPRVSRRRSSGSTQHNIGDTVKKDIQKQTAGVLSKDKKRGEEIKQKGRRSSEIEEDDDDMPSSDDESWNSEDDPDRLWCICKKPHNNRFMICCDVCEDWFHGKCVGVTKAMGQQMENKGLEWSCPDCTKKKELGDNDSKKITQVQKEKDIKKLKEYKEYKRDTDNEHVIDVSSSQDNDKDVTNAGEGSSSQSTSSSDAHIMYCIVCKKEARSSSIYCSDACILKHAQESLNVLNKEKATTGGTVNAIEPKDAVQQLQQQNNIKGSDIEPVNQADTGTGLPLKARTDARVIVFERKTGRLLAGPNAPTAGNLKSWLKDNPTFEVVRPGILPTTKFYSTKGGTKTVIVQSKLTPQKSVSSMPLQKVNSSPTPLPSKGAIPQKTCVVQQKSGVIQQRPVTTPVKNIINQQKQVIPIVPTKVVTAKVQKGPVVITQMQKVVIKTPPKTMVASTKPVLKSPTPSPSNPVKVPSSPSNKSILPPVVSKVPATSTVKETVKCQQEKTVAKKVEVKRQSSSSSSETSKKEEEKEKPSGPEPIRLNVRKTLQELLQTRIQECSDLEVSETEVQNIAVNIEEEMHSFFRDTGIKYKSKYRSLVFNIKDPKNLTLFRKIADRSLTPHQLVRLSPEELASQELAQWREREAKHQLEMIKKTELDLMSQAKTYVMKTHKGEQVIETDETLKVEVPDLVDPSTVPDLVSPVNNSVSSTVEDAELYKSKMKEKNSKEEKEHVQEREKSKHDDKKRDKNDKSRKEEDSRRDSHHDRHDRERRKTSREREKSRSSTKDKRRSDRSKRESDRHRDGKGSSSKKDKKEEIEKKDDTIKKEDVLSESKEEDIEREYKKTIIKEDSKGENGTVYRPKYESFVNIKSEPLEDSDLSDREPSSTVTIKTPDINMDDQERNVCATVWKGFVNMPDVAKFFTTVQIVSGDSQNLCKDLPDTVDIVGRIVPETVWDYISKMKKTGTKEILVIRLTAANDEEKLPYLTLYTYLNTRNRLGVVGNVSKMIKDFYIMPLARHSPVPQVLLPLDGPGFEDCRPHLLLGILVRARRKRLAPENEYVAKIPKRPPPPPTPIDTIERSYTPPLPSAGSEIGSLTPPHPPPSSVGSFTPPISPQPFISVPVLSNKNTDLRVNRIDLKDSVENINISDVSVKSLVNVEKPMLTSHVGQYGIEDDEDEDDDAPYSPGGSDDVEESSEDNLLLTPKNPTELQRKVEELNRKIEEQKQQIQSISSAIVGSDPTTAAIGPVAETLKVNTVMQNYIMASSNEETAEQTEDENEAYSPSRSFTPPSTSIPFIGPPETGSTSVFSSLPPNINLPSNLHEILANIKKQESDKAAGTTPPNKGINLKSDPIVQNYGKASDLETAQSKPSTDDISSVGASSIPCVTGTSGGASSITASATVLQSASSALLSLSTPVVHPLASGGSVVSTSVSTKVIDAKIHRDPRQRGSSEANNKSSGSTLSTLSDDDLIKKALEMEMEMTEPKIKTGGAIEKTAAVTIPTLPQPLPPGVDSLPTVPSSGPPSKSSLVVATGQPLPPGVEDEDYSSYTSSYGTSAQNSILPIALPMPSLGPSVNYSLKSSNSPAPYRMPHHYSGSGYVGPPSRVPSQGPGYSSTYASSSGYSGTNSATEDNSHSPTSKMKRKFSDSDVDDTINKRDRSGSPCGTRDAWDNKVPVPVRGRFGDRGRGFMRGAPSNQRGFMRPRGLMRPPPQNRSRWDTKDVNRKRSRYESGRLEWDAHKDYEEKHRDRSRDIHHRDRSWERPSSSQRSHGTRNRPRDSEKNSDSP